MHEFTCEVEYFLTIDKRYTVRMSKNIMLTVPGTFTVFFSPTTPIPRESHTIIL
jgi:hypothetical protein